MELPYGLFLSLPSRIACIIALQWLEPKHIGQLDSAYCNMVWRKQFASSILQAPHFCLDVCPLDHHISVYLAWISKRSVAVKSLVVSDATELAMAENYLAKFGEHISTITVQDLSDYRADIIQIYGIIAKHCCELTSLVCRNCLLTVEFIQLLTTCKGLTELRLRFCTEAPSCAITQLKTKSQLRLKVLALGSGNNIVLGVLKLCDLSCIERLVVGIESSSGMKKLKPLLAQCANLKSLGFFGSDPTYITDTVMMDIVSMCPHIVHLNIAGCDRLTDTSGTCIAQTLTHLRTLNMSYCRFSSATILALAEHCNNTLEGLYCMCAVDGTSLNVLIEQCTKLHTLSFDCYRFPASLGTPALSNITTLLLENASISEQIESVLHRCTHLQHLHLSFNAIEDIYYCPFDSLHISSSLYIHTVPDRKSTNVPELCEDLPSFVHFRETQPHVKVRFLQHACPPRDTLAYDVLTLPL